jgi:hypothetical protein
MIAKVAYVIGERGIGSQERALGYTFGRHEKKIILKGFHGKVSWAVHLSDDGSI